jgi:hypothetical protein
MDELRRFTKVRELFRAEEGSGRNAPARGHKRRASM